MVSGGRADIELGGVNLRIATAGLGSEAVVTFNQDGAGTRP